MSITSNVIYSALQWFSKGGIAQMLAGAGMSVIVSQGLDLMVSDSLAVAIGHINDLPPIALQFALMAGIGDALSIVGSAILTRVAMVAAGNIMGVAMKAQTHGG